MRSPRVRRPSSKVGAKARSECPISIALELLGDPWSLLVVRDLMFKDRRTFKDFLSAEEGIASNVLADRLRRLEEAGVVGSRPDPKDGRRVVYRLTRKGIDLAPVLVEIVLWSARYEKTAAPRATVKLMREQRESFIEDLVRAWEAARRQ